MDDFEQRVQAEIDQLVGPEFPTGRLARRQRAETIRALALATLEGRSWTGEKGVLGPGRPRLVVSETNFYGKKHWHPHPLTQKVIANVTALYMEREAQEREAARQRKRTWLEGKEFEATEKLFKKGNDLLTLPHITQKGKSADSKKEIILDPANAAVFNAAVNLMKAASELGRRSLGLPLDVRRNEVTGAEGGAVKTQEIGRVHGGAEHVAAVARILVEAGAVELRPVEPGSDAANDEVHTA